MRRPFAPLLAVSALALTACSSGSDDTADAVDTTLSDDDVSDDDVSDAGAADETRPPFNDAVQECADEPDPSEYVEGQIPPLIPPCDTPDELVVHLLREGVGAAAEEGDTLIVDYAGMVIGSGLVFDTSYTRDIPLDFPLGRGGVIDGWDQGLVGAQAGSLLRLDIPNVLAYGDTPPGEEIQPGDALSFNVEVRAVIESVTAEDAPLDLEIAPSVDAVDLTTTDITVGQGPAVELGDTAVVHMLLVRGDNEVVLFNTWERDDPLQIIMRDGQTLPGVFEGLQGVTVGTRRVMAMPPELAFGEGGEPSLGLPAGTDLIVVVDVLGVY